jgi:8-oxo-dGTP diphosphatase
MPHRGKRKPKLLHRGPVLTVDGVWFHDHRVLLVRRKNPPFRGRWAFPGGFVEPGESVETAVLREIREETGLSPRLGPLLGVYSKPDRDPRGPTASVVFFLEGPTTDPRGGSDAKEAAWVPLGSVPPLAFDHPDILRDALAARRRFSRESRVRSGRASARRTRAEAVPE